MATVCCMFLFQQQQKCLTYFQNILTYIATHIYSTFSFEYYLPTFLIDILFFIQINQGNLLQSQIIFKNVTDLNFAKCHN